MSPKSLFHDPDEIAWLGANLTLARFTSVASAMLFTVYAFVDNQITAQTLSQTLPLRLLGGVICLATLWGFSERRYARWGTLQTAFTGSSVITLVNLIFFAILRKPEIALASQMQCFMMLAILGPLRSTIWTATPVAMLTFNVGLLYNGATAQDYLLNNFFMVCGIAVLLGISHIAHANHREKRRLQSLAHTQARIVESSSDAIISCDSAMRITSWNEGAREVFGLERDRMLGQLLATLFAPSFSEGDLHKLQRALHGESADHFQSKWLHQHTTPIDVSVTFSPITGIQGEVSGVAAIARDVSQRRKAEEKLREKDAQFRSAIETSQEGFLAVDTQGHIVDTNHSYARMSGYAHADLLRLRMADLDAVESPAQNMERIEQVQRQGSATFESVHRRADGSLWPVEVIASYSKLNGGLFFVFIKDLTERKRTEELTWRQANYDTLTQLPNRALLFNRLAQECAQARRSNTSLALLFIDLDGFKLVNDAHGHAAGDEVLQEVARRWLTAVRTADTVARLGGDEFAVLLGGIHSPQAACTTAQKLIEALREPFVLSNGIETSVGASIGIAVFPKDADEPDALISKADAAMYESKHRGKNTYTLA